MTNNKRTDVERELGTVFNPHSVGVGYIVQFEYDRGNYIECCLEKDGTLAVRVSGRRSDMLATHHHVANSATIVPRRWDQKLERYVEMIRDVRGDTNGGIK